MKNPMRLYTPKKRLEAPIHADFDDLVLQINLTKPSFT